MPINELEPGLQPIFRHRLVVANDQRAHGFTSVPPSIANKVDTIRQDEPVLLTGKEPELLLQAPDSTYDSAGLQPRGSETTWQNNATSVYLVNSDVSRITVLYIRQSDSGRVRELFVLATEPAQN